MKFVKSLAVAVLALMSLSASAQSYEAKNGTKYDFQKHWFLDVEGGAQYTLGESTFRRLVSPNAQLGIGRQFAPWFGARLQANAWESRGGWSGYVPQGGQVAFTKSYKYNYVAPGIDAMFNLTNLILGYNPVRIVNVTAFLGAGVNFAFGNEEVNDIAKNLSNTDAYLLENLWDGSKVLPFGRGGLQFSFKLSDMVNLLIEGNANVLNDKYNSKKDHDNNMDWYFNAVAGLRINLGKPHTKMVKEVITITEPVQVETKTVYVTKHDTVYVTKPEALRREVFFEINKSEIRASEQAKVKDVADYLQKYPNSKVSLCGYADVQTGNDEINDKLGLSRVEAVKDALINQYGISASRITTDSKGARVQPFPVNEQNRVTICIAE